MMESRHLRQAQLAFWTEFSQAAAAHSLRVSKPAAKNWCYVPVSAGRAKIVLAVGLDAGWVECKLALPSQRAETVDGTGAGSLGELFRERMTIEQELGFSNLVWGDPTPTRIYRRSPMAVADHGVWPRAFEWLIDTADRFRAVFGSRLAGMPAPAAVEVANARR
jgi:hypothetical protein